MKYVQVPEDLPITIPNPCPLCRHSVGDNSVKTDTWSFARYLENLVLGDPGMGSGYDSWKAYAVLNKTFKDMPSDTCVVIDEAHWKLLCEIINGPKGNLPNGDAMHQFLPFMDAILDADSENPLPVSKPH